MIANSWPVKPQVNPSHCYRKTDPGSWVLDIEVCLWARDYPGQLPVTRVGHVSLVAKPGSGDHPEFLEKRLVEQPNGSGPPKWSKRHEPKSPR